MKLRHNFAVCCVEALQPDGRWLRLPWLTDEALCDADWRRDPMNAARDDGYCGA